MRGRGFIGRPRPRLTVSSRLGWRFGLQFAEFVIRQPARRDDRQQREARHDEEPAARPLSATFQAETDQDPANSREDEIDAEENAENVQARDRPLRQDHAAEEDVV